MAKLLGKGKIDFEFTLSLTEEEFNAIGALSIYHTDDILKMLGNHISQNLVKEHAKGLCSLLDSVNRAGLVIRPRIAAARDTFNKLADPT